MFTERRARELATQIEYESAERVKVMSVFRPTRGKYWRLRVLLIGRERLQVVESEDTWLSLRGAWNELVPGLFSRCLHRWSRLPRSVGLFQCTACGSWGVCPGCLSSLNVALVASDAGFEVLWCAAHDQVEVRVS